MSKNRTMIITGGSRGIGRATALLAARDNWNVVINYRSNHSAAEETIAAIHDEGNSAHAVIGDVCNEIDVRNLFSETISRFGSVEAVIINAGIVAPSQTLAEMDLDRIKKVIDTNFLGAMICARQAAKTFLQVKSDKDRSITFVSSAAARLGSPFEYVDYAASKGAIDTLVIGLSKELATQNIRVNGVRPGIIETEIHASGGEPDRVERLSGQVPLKRAGRAEEVAAAILWLSQQDASYTTGALLDVAGGR